MKKMLSLVCTLALSTALAACSSGAVTEPPAGSETVTEAPAKSGAVSVSETGSDSMAGEEKLGKCACQPIGQRADFRASLRTKSRIP